MSLPVELLEIIFKFCYLGCQQGRYNLWEPSLSNILQQFLYSLVTVDPLWNSILLKHQVVINVDSKTPTHIDDTQRLLQYMLYKMDPEL